MDTIHLKKLLDTCFLAKKTIETLPELPKGMKPRHIHVLDQIYENQEKKGICRVSDVSQGLHITMPSVTKLVKELEILKLLEKEADQNDKRVYLLKLTKAGKQCVQEHVIDFHQQWAIQMKDIDNEQIDEVVDILNRLYVTMPRKGENKDGK